MRHVTALIALILTLSASVGRAQAPVAVEGMGPQPGTRVPEFTARDQSGRAHTLTSLLGPQGAMLVFSRSADW